jgi:hypothetical protein
MKRFVSLIVTSCALGASAIAIGVEPLGTVDEPTAVSERDTAGALAGLVNSEPDAVGIESEFAMFRTAVTVLSNELAAGGTKQTTLGSYEWVENSSRAVAIKATQQQLEIPSGVLAPYEQLLSTLKASYTYRPKPTSLPGSQEDLQD